MRFEFCKKYHGTTYVYNSENHILYTRDDSAEQVEYARHHFSECQAVRLLSDILSGTVHPLDDYIRATTIEALPACLKGERK